MDGPFFADKKNHVLSNNPVVVRSHGLSNGHINRPISRTVELRPVELPEVELLFCRPGERKRIFEQ